MCFIVSSFYKFFIGKKHCVLGILNKIALHKKSQQFLTICFAQKNVKMQQQQQQQQQTT